MEYARVERSKDPSTWVFLGRTGRIVSGPARGGRLALRRLVVLEFANGEREVFVAEDLALAAGPNPDEPPMRAARPESIRAPTRTPGESRPQRHAAVAVPGYCVHGHPRVGMETCKTCDQVRKQRVREETRRLRKEDSLAKGDVDGHKEGDDR